MGRWMAIIAALLLLAGCGFFENPNQAENTNESNHGINGKDRPSEGKTTDQDGAGTGKEGGAGTGTGKDGTENGTGNPIQTAAYLPSPNQIKMFKGTGNEYAAEVERIFSREGEFFASVTENGGTSVLRIYGLGKEGVSIVYEEPEYYSENPPDIKKFKPAFKPRLVLPSQLRLNQQFEGWTVKDLNAIITVPYGTISKAIILEKIGEDGSIVQNCWAPGLGIVKKSYYIKDTSGSETSVTTELESVEPRNW
ncbi:hypothetical protein DRW41_20295 [Neobacillus piezotolerans]|uniref:Lipoprotein n=1 Tax=Neobacillus piezotolerans TaxID=2259171 RepID=A0A3D8GKV8_9BACI|nr:hypothetical protein [Neobacillus piezotolerans]RDU34962.1 hypothetical protein DRW41_20295 [Neobacillus piezotolerans]